MENKFEADLHELEELLVKQFRTLQALVELSLKEQKMILNGDDNGIMQVVEDKEVQLDAMILMEDSIRHQVQNLALALSLHSEETSINDLLPHLNNEAALRIHRLAEGITTLSKHGRELNRTNQALSKSKIEYLQAFQEFLVDITQHNSNSYTQDARLSNQDIPSFGVEYRV